ncbi:hypothetical protein R6Q57_021284 [Mikania cordata]
MVRSLDTRVQKWIKISSTPAKLDKKASKLKNMLLVDRKKKVDEDYECSDDDLQQPKRKESAFFRLCTRSSPAQLYRCVRLLIDKQRKDVVDMGFGSLINFNVDGIPRRVDKESVKNLLGLCSKGRRFEQITPLDVMDKKVTEWPWQYEGRFVGASSLVDNIQRLEVENNFNFRMNFAMLFVIVLVECTNNGRMKEDILRYFYSGTDFSKFDWCDFIVDKTRGCKSGWLRCDNRSPFNDPLTILTLLYVNSIDCKGLKVDPTKQPITFWTKAMLRKREKLEIRDGGFGKGKRREVMRVEELASEDGVHVPLYIKVMNEDEVEEEGLRNEDNVKEGNDGWTANEGVRNEDVVEEVFHNEKGEPSFSLGMTQIVVEDLNKPEKDIVKQTMETISEGKKNEGKEHDDNKSPQVMHQQPNTGKEKADNKSSQVMHQQSDSHLN